MSEKQFVRLTEDEVAEFVDRWQNVEIMTSYELICAVENRLAEKNTAQKEKTWQEVLGSDDEVL